MSITVRKNERSSGPAELRFFLASSFLTGRRNGSVIAYIRLTNHPFGIGCHPRQNCAYQKRIIYDSEKIVKKIYQHCGSNGHFDCFPLTVFRIPGNNSGSRHTAYSILHCWIEKTNCSAKRHISQQSKVTAHGYRITCRNRGNPASVPVSVGFRTARCLPASLLPEAAHRKRQRCSGR